MDSDFSINSSKRDVLNSIPNIGHVVINSQQDIEMTRNFNLAVEGMVVALSGEISRSDTLITSIEPITKEESKADSFYITQYIIREGWGLFKLSEVISNNKPQFTINTNRDSSLWGEFERDYAHQLKQISEVLPDTSIILDNKLVHRVVTAEGEYGLILLITRESERHNMNNPSLSNLMIRGFAVYPDGDITLVAAWEGFPGYYKSCDIIERSFKSRYYRIWFQYTGIGGSGYSEIGLLMRLIVP